MAFRKSGDVLPCLYLREFSLPLGLGAVVLRERRIL